MNPRDFLQFLDSPQGQDFLAEFTDRPYDKGQLISTPAGEVNKVFIVRSGRVRVYLSDGHRELTLAFLEGGELFTTHTPTFVEAVQPTVLALVDTRRFATLLAREPGAVASIMRVLGTLLGNTIDMVENLAFRDARQRLTHFLVSVARRQGARAEGGPCTVSLSVTLTEAALLLGSTRQTVSAVLNEMVREGLLERLGRQKLLIHDLSKLEVWGMTPSA
jgi:CRP-like cAMP-binding protein